MAAFSVTPFEQVSMEDIAAQAEISRALIYHYFPSKKELFAALWTRAHEQLSAGSQFTPTGTVRSQVRAALVTYYAFYERNLTLVMIANRSAIAADPVVRDPITMELNGLRDRIVDSLDLTRDGRDVMAVALFRLARAGPRGRTGMAWATTDLSRSRRRPVHVGT